MLPCYNLFQRLWFIVLLHSADVISFAAQSLSTDLFLDVLFHDRLHALMSVPVQHKEKNGKDTHRNSSCFGRPDL